MTSSLDLDYLQSWIGRREEATDLIDARRVAQMRGTLGHLAAPGSGLELPLPWHWLFFTPVPEAGATGLDGHPAKGGFLPPVPLPRRMWAGGRVLQHKPVEIGSPMVRVSTIGGIELKEGRGGSLVFVTVDHALYLDSGDLAIEEQQSLVFREPAAVGVVPEARSTVDRDMPKLAAQWEVAINPDPVLLFRYSALTFNAHRIHYDRDYAVNDEGYAGLVVQGPLIASLLLQCAAKELAGAAVREFSFRARRPLFVGETAFFSGAVDGDRLTLWALTPDRELAMRLDASLGVKESEV